MTGNVQHDPQLIQCLDTFLKKYKMAFYSLSSQDVTTNTITLMGSAGVGGETIYNDGTNTLWFKQNKSAVFVDSTDSSQDMNTSPVAINFDTVVYNDINLSFGGTTFTFNEGKYYQINFECLLSNSDAQTMISFRLNGNMVYGNLSTFIPGINNPVPFYSSYILQINPGDMLEVVGEKYNSGPNYLLKNPIYGIPVTKLEIISI